LIGPLGPGTVIPIPYDFDFSGLVDATYATPPDELHLSDVRQRQYRGYCMHNGTALAAARQMRDQRAQMMAALSSVPGLDPKTQQRAVSYLNGFFNDAATDQAVQDKMLKRCVG
jgi:hypothetical protein